MTVLPQRRGVVRIRSTYPGIAVFELRTCRGRLIGTPTFTEDVVDEDLLADLHRILERACPEDHGPSCPSDVHPMFEPDGPTVPVLRLQLGRRLGRLRS